MAKSSQVKVQESRRQVVFKSGQRLELHNVTAFDPSGTWLRIWSDEGLAILNTDSIEYHLITSLRQDDQEESDECEMSLGDSRMRPAWGDVRSVNTSPNPQPGQWCYL